jgi:hypothetical protein
MVSRSSGTAGLAKIPRSPYQMLYFGSQKTPRIAMVPAGSGLGGKPRLLHLKKAMQQKWYLLSRFSGWERVCNPIWLTDFLAEG